jgi:hypothetical protein
MQLEVEALEKKYKYVDETLESGSKYKGKILAIV